MLDSTARAERIDLSPSELASYTWEVAQKPVVVRLPLALIDRLEAEAVETFRSLTSRGSEIGGLLLGSAPPGNPALVTVADFDLVPCDYSRGPLYRLSDIDLGRFEQAIEKHNTGGGQRVVGYFRSHTRKGLSLDAEDIAFFEPRFLEPQQIVLMIRPFATKASTAGIFIRENGRIGENSHLEFPFRSADLRASHRGGEKAESAGAASPSASSAPAPAAPKPAARAQIVPIASRREISLPEPVAAPQPAVPIVAERVEAPAAPPAKSAAPLPAVQPEPASAPVEKPAAPETKPAKSAAVESKPAPKPAPAVVAEPKPEPAGGNKMVRLLVAAAIGMLALVGGGLVVYPMLRSHLNPPSNAVQQDTSPLSLRVERTPGGMLLTWRRDSPVIQNATKVELSITDGDRHEIIQLDPNQVRSGSILYPPITPDVSFQMAVTDPHQAKTTSESLRVLDPRPSPLVDPSDPAAAAAAAAKQPPTPSKPATTTAPESAVAEETKPVVEETPVSHPATPLKPFNTESLAQRLRPVTATDLPDAPSITRANNSSAASLPGIVPNQPAPPPPPKSTPNAVPPVAASAPSAPSGGQLMPAVVITRVDAEYPKMARQAGASGLVEIEATIGLDGKVKNPHVLKGNSMLQKAAIDAVLQWRYKPATLNGKPVESPVDIKLNFVPTR